MRVTNLQSYRQTAKTTRKMYAQDVDADALSENQLDQQEI